MPCYEIDGVRPVIEPSTYVHPSADIIGDVIIGPGCYIGPSAVIRGDFGPIQLQAYANLQDTCVMHGFPNILTLVEEYGHIGHGAVIHGARIGKNAMIGMNSVLMDECEIGENSIVGAMAFVRAKTKFEANSLIVGSPAKCIRSLSKDEIAWKTKGTDVYRDLTRRCHASLKQVEPYTEIDANRPSIEIEYDTFAEFKQRKNRA